MRKNTKVNRHTARAAAVVLAAVMAVQPTAPAMASLQYGKMVSAASTRYSGRAASPSDADTGRGSGKSTPSNATPSNPHKPEASEKATLSNALHREATNIHPNGSF